MAVDRRLFSDFRIFARVESGLIDELARTSELRRFRRDEVLLRQGEPYNSLWLLLSGSVDTEMRDASGRSLIVERLNAPEILAAAILFAADNELPVSVTARGEATAALIGKTSLLKAMGSSAELLENIMGELADKLVLLSRRLAFMSFRSIKSKVAHFLVGLPMKAGQVVVLPLSIEELAAYFGVARPALSKVLIGMAEQGLIEQHQREIKLLEVEALLELAE